MFPKFAERGEGMMAHQVTSQPWVAVGVSGADEGGEIVVTKMRVVLME